MTDDERKGGASTATAGHVETIRQALRAHVAVVKDKIAEWADENELPGNHGIITLALLELAIERQLVLSDENGAAALAEAVIRKVVAEKRGPLQ